MNTPLEPDDRLARRLQAAHAVLDEQPSGKTRAAILSAAAQRRKVLAAAVAAARARDRSLWDRLVAWRPPLAAGAAVCAGVLAISIGLRVEHEQGALAPPLAPAAPADGGTAPPAPEAKLRSVVPVPQKLEAGRAERPPALRSGPTASEAAQAGAALPTAGASAAAGAASEMKSQIQTAPAASPALAAPAPSAARSAFSGTVAEPGARARRELDAAPNVPSGVSADRQPLGRSERLQAPSSEPAATYTSSPQVWIKHIAELRAAQRDAQADQELARFMAAYPNLPVPQSAQRR